MNLIKHFVRRYILVHVYNLLGCYYYYGEKVFFPRHSTTFISGFRSGIYEPETLAIILHLLKKDSVFFDIGANIGLISIPVLVLRRDIRVVSFEPSPNTLPFLRKTNSSSNFRERWSIIDKAVSDQIGEVSFSLAEKRNGAFESIRNTRRVSEVNSISIASTTIDFEWNHLGCPHVSVIKCDIEGADLWALKGAKECIKQNRPYIIIEWNQDNIAAFSLTSQQLLDFIFSIGYSIYTINSFVKLTNANELNLHGVFSEMYLLVPDLD